MPHNATLVPNQTPDVTYYQVLDDLGKFGRVWGETAELYSEEDVIRDILTGQFSKPIMVVAFNPAEGWARDVTEDIARAVAERARSQGTELRKVASRFYENATCEDVPADLRSFEEI